MYNGFQVAIFAVIDFLGDPGTAEGIDGWIEINFGG